MDNKLTEILQSVRKPGRYIGCEWNSALKKSTDDIVRVLLAFPDAYEIGMSHLGIKILHGILNRRVDCICERVFSPWVDFEEALRRSDMRLFSLESRRPIREFDIIGFSLSYELSYTNVLNMLDLGGIPLKSSDRDDGCPVVIAGGPACFNPEPMADYIDAFLMGDGEDAVLEIVDAYKMSGRVSSGRRQRVLKELSGIKGVYVPSVHETGKVKICRRVVTDLDTAYYPVDQIVPNIGIVHDRLAIEIMRGCKHACRFCQAQAIYGPARERSAATVVDIARRSYLATGYDEISLLSLSSVDHSELHRMIVDMNREFCHRGVSLSVPSLRVEDSLKELPTLISAVKKTGLTFAPEAGTERLRAFLNKNIDIQKLYDSCSEAFGRGWRKVKLYFMIGIPGESDEDIVGIADMIMKVSSLKSDMGGAPAQVTASINPFVPKPHTPLERHPMDTIGSLRRKRDLLRSCIKSRRIDLDFNSLERSQVEAVLSRGDRAIGRVIYEAWRSGARFDGWQDMFRYETWKASFERCGVDPSRYVYREIPASEGLPWGFVSIRSFDK